MNVFNLLLVYNFNFYLIIKIVMNCLYTTIAAIFLQILVVTLGHPSFLSVAFPFLIIYILLLKRALYGSKVQLVQ